MRAGIESLNAAVAGGILLYEISRRKNRIHGEHEEKPELARTQ
jgi:hypothetical protein